MRNKCKIFADDFKIYMATKLSDCVDVATHVLDCQRDIDVLVNVSKSWGLNMNVDKCAVLRFQRGDFDWHQLGILSKYYIGCSPIRSYNDHRDLGVTVDITLKFHKHIQLVVNKAGGMASNFLRSTVCRSREFMLSLYISHIRPLLEFSSCVWNTGYAGDLKLLESVQRRWTKQIDGLQSIDYSTRLIMLNLYSVKGRLIRADMIKMWKIFHGKCSIDPADLFELAPVVGTRGHPFKIFHSRAGLECRCRCFAVRVVEIWNSLPDEVVCCDTVAQFKSKLHCELGELLFDFVG